MERERRLAEKEVREVVADVESPLAQRHIRNGIRKNKVALVLYTIAFVAPAAFLASFYYAKLKDIRLKFRDPYALPEGFNPLTGEFTDSSNPVETIPVPKSLVLGSAPGSYSGKRSPKEKINDM